MYPVGIVMTGGNSLAKYGGDAGDSEFNGRSIIER